MEKSEMAEEDMTDGGAPLISAAQSEFERAATHWQQESAKAAAMAAYYSAMAVGLREVYQRTIAQSFDPGD